MNALEHTFLIIVLVALPAFVGGVLIDPIDHYNPKLSLWGNIKFWWKCGVVGSCGMPCEIPRDCYAFNFFHKWRNLFYVALVVSVFLLGWTIHLLHDQGVFW